MGGGGGGRMIGVISQQMQMSSLEFIPKYSICEILIVGLLFLSYSEISSD